MQSADFIQKNKEFASLLAKKSGLSIGPVFHRTPLYVMAPPLVILGYEYASVQG
jgi:hypothetical protein